MKTKEQQRCVFDKDDDFIRAMESAKEDRGERSNRSKCIESKRSLRLKHLEARNGTENYRPGVLRSKRTFVRLAAMTIGG